MARVVVTLLLTALASVPAAAQRRESVLGTRVQLDVGDADRVSGELVAAQGDSLWLLPPGGALRLVPLGRVTRARVPRPGITAGGIMIWAGIGGLVSGLGLTLACSSVEDTGGCGAVLPAVLAGWALVGGISAAITGSGWRTVATDSLAPYARFPQGLPETFRAAPPEERRADGAGEQGGPPTAATRSSSPAHHTADPRATNRTPAP